jgi:hypothetical protein
MKRNTLIEHKKIAILCEERGPVSLNYNALLTTLEANVVVKPIVPTIIVKSTLTCTNCGKIGHLMETCHNKEKEAPIVPTVIVKFTKLIAR